MKKSNVVFTSLLTGGALLGILHHDPVYRDQYASREECLADWGRYPNACEPESSGSGSSGGGSSGGSSRYRGPSYEEGERPATSRQGLVQSRQMVTRGGFGSSGAHFSGGG